MSRYDAMAHGASLFDQLGWLCAIQRDAIGLIIHFEKMLYDNALLIEAYTRGWLDQRSPLYAAVVEETVGWLEREMEAPCGGFTRHWTRIAMVRRASIMSGRQGRWIFQWWAVAFA